MCLLDHRPQEVSPVAGVWKQTNHSHMSHILTFSHVSHVSHVSHSQILIVHTCSTTTGGPPAHLHIRCFGNWTDFRITATYSQLIVGHIYILRLEGGIPHIPNGLSRLKPGVSKQETLSKQKETLSRQVRRFISDWLHFENHSQTTTTLFSLAQ